MTPTTLAEEAGGYPGEELTAEQEALVREWAEGQRKLPRLRTSRPLSQRKTLTVIVQLLATLDAARAENARLRAALLQVFDDARPDSLTRSIARNALAERNP